MIWSLYYKICYNFIAFSLFPLPDVFLAWLFLNYWKNLHTSNIQPDSTKPLQKKLCFFCLFFSWMKCSIINASAFQFLDLKVCKCVMLKTNKKNRWQDLKDQISFVSIWNLRMASLFPSNSFILSWILWWKILCTIMQYKYLRVIIKYDSVIK